MKQYTIADLAEGDGKEGRRALVAAGGKIWDVTESKMWRNGTHMNSHTAGEDLTVALEAAPHGAEVMDRYDVVGHLASKPERKHREFPEPSPFVKKILDQHLHPISAHFPIGLGMASAFFAATAAVFDLGGMAEAAFYNLLLAALSAPMSILAGFLSWYYNYGGIWTSIFKTKAVLSAILLIAMGTALGIKFHLLTTSSPNPILEWIYIGLALSVAPNVAAIGRLGGKITFPS